MEMGHINGSKIHFPQDITDGVRKYADALIHKGKVRRKPDKFFTESAKMMTTLWNEEEVIGVY